MAAGAVMQGSRGGVDLPEAEITCVKNRGGHSASDTVLELFPVASVRRSERPADDLHPFGYRAERFFSPLIAAVGIFVAGGGFSLLEADRAFVAPPGAGSWTLGYVTLAVSGLFEGISLVRASHQVRTEAAIAGRRPAEHVAKSADPAVKTVGRR
jgi:divalent metal cation (Fe/Co/Zn/Cd) transporter